MIMDTDEHHSTVMLELPNVLNIFPTFHTSEVFPFIKNNPVLFPSWKFEEPPPILTPEGNEELSIDKILDQHHQGCSYQYLVCWHRYRHEHDWWLPHSELQDCSALDNWLANSWNLSSFSISPPCQLVAFSHRVLMHLCLDFYLPFH